MICLNWLIKFFSRGPRCYHFLTQRRTLRRCKNPAAACAEPFSKLWTLVADTRSSPISDWRGDDGQWTDENHDDGDEDRRWRDYGPLLLAGRRSSSIPGPPPIEVIDLIPLLLDFSRFVISRSRCWIGAKVWSDWRQIVNWPRWKSGRVFFSFGRCWIMWIYYCRLPVRRTTVWWRMVARVSDHCGVSRMKITFDQCSNQSN